MPYAWHYTRPRPVDRWSRLSRASKPRIKQLQPGTSIDLEAWVSRSNGPTWQWQCLLWSFAMGVVFETKLIFLCLFPEWVCGPPNDGPARSSNSWVRKPESGNLTLERHQTHLYPLFKNCLKHAKSLLWPPSLLPSVALILSKTARLSRTNKMIDILQMVCKGPFAPGWGWSKFKLIWP